VAQFRNHSHPGARVARLDVPPAVRTGLRSQERAFLVLAIAAVVSLALKAVNVSVGAPQYMIDDFTLYEGGFLVWFGQAPPQHAFLEAWLCGLCSLLWFAVKTVLAGQSITGTEGYFVAGALRDFYNAPDSYYVVYRSFLIGVDFVTALFVWKLARRVLDDVWGAAWVTALFLFSYNTLWSALVGRPDTLMTCAATIGLYLYLKSGSDDSRPAFWWSAICAGLAAGLKMHGAFVAIFVSADLLRSRGLRAGWRPAIAFAATSFVVFLVADGSLLFDPLVYVKARMATYHDDYSPYIQWGDQFRVILRATGWLIVPLALAGVLTVFRDRAPRLAPLRSVAFVALGWLAIFCITRQLRGYWMLAAAPLFYILAAQGLERIRQPRLRAAVMTGVLVVMVAQTAALSWRTYRTPLDGLREWVIANVGPGERFYIFGDSILRLPKDTATMQLYRTAYERQMAADLAAGMPFVERHLKNWEETAQLRLFDMLGYRNDGGRTFYHYRDLPPERFGDLAPVSGMDYLIVQEKFPVHEVPGLERLLATEFRLVAERRSEGGDGRGLMHRIYTRASS
jgi:hypothetical protein